MEEGTQDLSALSMLISQRGVTFFTDTYVTVDPSAEEIAEMTVLAAREITRFGIEPKAALLSHSNFGSRDSEPAMKMRKATTILHRIAPDLCVDGEMHSDAALDARLRERVYPNSVLNGEANLLVFPNLDSANITLNAVKSMTEALHVRSDPCRHRQAGAYPDAVGNLARRRQHDGAGGRRGRANATRKPSRPGSALTLGAGNGGKAGRLSAQRHILRLDLPPKGLPMGSLNRAGLIAP